MSQEARPDPRPELARTALTDAMVRLVSEQEHGEITVSQLCKAAGVSRPTFYRYFKTADEVLARAVRQRLDGVEQGIPADAPELERMPPELQDFLAELWRERRLYRAALRPEAPYHHTKRVTSAWLEETIRRHAEEEGMAAVKDPATLAFTAGGVLSVIAMLVEQEDLTRDKIEAIGQALWELIGRVLP